MCSWAVNAFLAMSPSIDLSRSLSSTSSRIWSRTVLSITLEQLTGGVPQQHSSVCISWAGQWCSIILPPQFWDSFLTCFSVLPNLCWNPIVQIPSARLLVPSVELSADAFWVIFSGSGTEQGWVHCAGKAGTIWVSSAFYPWAVSFSAISLPILS